MKGRVKTMKFSWMILAIMLVINLVWIGTMLVAQYSCKGLPSRGSIIPGTKQKFLYIEDFWTMTWGDTIGVWLMNCSFVHLMVNAYLNVRHWIVFVVLVVAISIGFTKMCLSKDHKPDYGFPHIGKVSIAGLLHSPYLGVGVTASIFCLWFAISGILRGPILYIWLSGLAFYAICFVAEIRSGNFDPLKLEK